MADNFIVYERDGQIARITLNRPEKLNTWDFPHQGGITDQFYTALAKAEDDDDVKVIIIRGSGRAFSAGHDLSTVGFVYGIGTGKAGERRASQRIRLKVDRRWLENHQKLMLCQKVTIAQVHGICIGEGAVMAEMCDIAIAADDAQIAHSEQRLGFSGSGMNLVPLYLAVGIKRARELLLTGRFITGKQAAEIGLVARSVPGDTLEEEVDKTAKAVCLLPRDGISIGKMSTHMIYDILGMTQGLTQGYISHTMFTNLRWEDDEYNFFKERRNQGLKTGFHGRDDRYKGLV